MTEPEVLATWTAEPCNVENMTKWIEALESSRYQQVPERLHDGDNGYCCLGVCAVTAGKQFVENPNVHTNHGERYGYWAADGEWQSTALDADVLEWLGVSSRSAVLGDVVVGQREYHGRMIDVAGSFANDTLDWDFTEIANSLRARYGIAR